MFLWTAAPKLERQMSPAKRRPMLESLFEQAKVPVLVDAGVGTASDAAIAMELGCDGVLMNTAVAAAKKPVQMARAMKKAVEAGREAYETGLAARGVSASWTPFALW